MAAMDVTLPNNNAISKKYNITGFPTLIYFESGVMQYAYPGENNRASLVRSKTGSGRKTKRIWMEGWTLWSTPSDWWVFRKIIIPQYAERILNVLAKIGGQISHSKGFSLLLIYLTLLSFWELLQNELTAMPVRNGTLTR